MGKPAEPDERHHSGNAAKLLEEFLPGESTLKLASGLK